jgi:hypothetical protein
MSPPFARRRHLGDFATFYALLFGRHRRTTVVAPPPFARSCHLGAAVRKPPLLRRRNYSCTTVRAPLSGRSGATIKRHVIACGAFAIVVLLSALCRLRAVCHRCLRVGAFVALLTACCRCCGLCAAALYTPPSPPPPLPPTPPLLRTCSTVVAASSAAIALFRGRLRFCPASASVTP